MEITIKDHDEQLMSKIRKARELTKSIVQEQQQHNGSPSDLEDLQHQLNILKQDIADDVIGAFAEAADTLDMIDSMKSLKH